MKYHHHHGQDGLRWVMEKKIIKGSYRHSQRTSGSGSTIQTHQAYGQNSGGLQGDHWRGTFERGTPRCSKNQRTSENSQTKKKRCEKSFRQSDPQLSNRQNSWSRNSRVSQSGFWHSGSFPQRSSKEFPKSSGMTITLQGRCSMERKGQEIHKVGKVVHGRKQLPISMKLLQADERSLRLQNSSQIVPLDNAENVVDVYLIRYVERNISSSSMCPGLLALIVSWRTPGCF